MTAPKNPRPSGRGGRQFADPDGVRWEVAHNPTPLGTQVVEASRRWLAGHARVAEQAAPAQVAEELKEREPLFHREPRDSGRAHFEAMTTEDLMHIGASGIRSTREEIVELVTGRYERGEHGDDHTWVVDEFEVTPVSDDIWMATYLLHQGPRVSRRTTIWVRTRQGWKVRFHQGSLVGAG